MEILIAAVFLHDIGRHYGYEFHGPESTKYAKLVLDRINFPREKRGAVLEAIAMHDYQIPSSKRKSIEAKILYDADKLDAFGKIGIERHIKFYLNRGKTPKEILKMLEERWSGLGLDESKKQGRKDYELIYNYFKNMAAEGGITSSIQHIQTCPLCC